MLTLYNLHGDVSFFLSTTRKHCTIHKLFLKWLSKEVSRRENSNRPTPPPSSQLFLNITFHKLITSSKLKKNVIQIISPGTN